MHVQLELTTIMSNILQLYNPISIMNEGHTPSYSEQTIAIPVLIYSSDIV